MKQNLHVEVGNYNIEISNENVGSVLDELKLFVGDKRCFFVTDKNVYKLYRNVLGLDSKEVFILPPGEKEKNFKNYIKILEAMEQAGLTREDTVVALGGGVVGDMAGFAAATYMRGIDYIQIPTTLLSMVDSSVGGKTAIDMKDAKNIVGAFHQPKAVFININFLSTLDKRQLMSGLGEILKYAFIEDSCGYKQSVFMFEYLTLCCEKLFALDSITLMRVIDYCLKLKIEVVNKDEKEASLRRILNLGHTLAHALETVTKYKKYTHGEAVVAGLFFAFEVAYKKGLISYSYYRLSTELLSKYGFNLKDEWKKYDSDLLAEIMKKDKKALKDKMVFILPCDKKLVKEVKLSKGEVLGFLKGEYLQR